MLLGALLHDIGKPFSAFPNNRGTYSYKNHAEVSYQLIKNLGFISDYTKNLVRYHFLLRSTEKAKEKGKIAEYKKGLTVIQTLDTQFKRDLELFQTLDDRAKKFQK